MPTLAEIMSNPEALEKAAEDFAAYHAARAKSDDDMNKGIQTDEEFIAIMNKCGTNPNINYKAFCEIGKDD